MKQLLLPVFALIFVFSASSQNLDDGVSPLTIEGDPTKLRGLTVVEQEELWNPVLAPDYFDYEYATYNVNGFKVNSFFGLEIDRVEVVSTSWEDAEGKTVKQIRQFTLLIEDPGTTDYNAFMKKVEDAYGPILTYSISEEDWSESPNWFTEITLLTVSGKDHRIEHDGKKYIMVQFMSGRGG